MKLGRRGFLGASLSLPLLGGPAMAAAQPALLFRNVHLFDGVSPGRRPVNVRTSGDRIDAIDTGEIALPTGGTVIDGMGHTLMPGLTDAHWHMAAVKGARWLGPENAVDITLILQDAERQLLRGFTTVRDTAGSIFGIRDAIEQGVAPGPRCFPSGAALSQTSGHADFDPAEDLPTAMGGEASFHKRRGMTAVVNGVPEVLAAARQQFKRGATQIKVMAGGGVTSDFDPIDTLQFTPAELRAAVQAASDWGSYVCAHVYTPAGIRRCVEAGVKSIEHGHLLDDRTAAMMAENDTWLVTQPFESGDNYLTPEQKVKALESLGSEGWRKSVGLAKKHGVKLAFGADLFGRTADSRTENAMLTRLGAVYSNAEVLRIATSGNCALFAESGRRNPYRAAPLGVAREGAWADLILVRGNPLEDLTLLEDHARNILTVMKGGMIYKNIAPG